MLTRMSPGFIHSYLNVAWAVGLTLEAIGAVAILKRRLLREIPAFSTYILYAAISDILGFWISLRHPSAYYLYYWIAQAGYKILNAWVVLEIYFRLMHSFPALRKPAAWTLWIALIIGVVSAGLIWSFAPLPKASPLEEHMQQIGYSLKMLQLGLLIAVVVIVQVFRLQLRRYYVFIAVGIALSALGDLSNFALISNYGYSNFYLFTCINLTINGIGSAVWVYVLITGEPRRPSAGAYAATSVEDLRAWNTAISDLQR
jgi:hypothetical protein